MCGIAGVVFGEMVADASPKTLADRMINTLAHRGPDGINVWAEGVVGLGHARLAIRDLTPTGAQPMVSRDGRWVIVYNGEVYSQPELQRALAAAGIQLRGTSDTEAMLEHIATFGLDRTLPELIGMFAFALWDRKLRELHLVRDRMGIKPLYWAQVKRTFSFSSELKALVEVGGWSPGLNRDAIAAYMRHNYIPAPHTVYRDVYKLEPGHVLTVHDNGSIIDKKFWSVRDVAISGIRSRIAGVATPSIDGIEDLLQDAVSRRLVSDVPVGALLSGGIDSSLVTALMARSSTSQIRTYSVGVPVSGYDEAPHARAIAAHLGTEHTELYVEPSLALDLVPRLPRIYDEPFADSSQLPSILVSELTRQHVTVALSGDGGDELFAGYNRYTLGLEVAARLDSIPRALRSSFATLALATPEQVLNRLVALAPARLRRANAGTKIKDLARMFARNDANAFYRGLVTHWPSPEAIVLGAQEPQGPLWDTQLISQVPDRLDRMQLLDMLTYLPDDILVKMDRASMSVGLEARVPLLDHRLVELSWRIPQHMKIRDGKGKWVLREILARHVPRELWDRPKMGFGIPIDIWLRGPLRTWAEDLLSEQRLRSQGLLDPAPIRARWAAHLRGEDWGYPLWDVLMLQAWLDEWQPSLGLANL